jgi:hypothetical protein
VPSGPASLSSSPDLYSSSFFAAWRQLGRFGVFEAGLVGGLSSVSRARGGAGRRRHQATDRRRPCRVSPFSPALPAFAALACPACLPGRPGIRGVALVAGLEGLRPAPFHRLSAGAFCCVWFTVFLPGFSSTAALIRRALATAVAAFCPADWPAALPPPLVFTDSPPLNCSASAAAGALGFWSIGRLLPAAAPSACRD